MSTLELKVYDIFKTKLGDTEAKAIIEYFEAKAEEKYEQKKDVLTTKEDLSNIEKSLKTEIHQLELRLVKQIYWVNIIQFLATIGSILAILKFGLK
ncbi:MAG: hypothetical protein LBE82_11530 [Chitinophagaceae bacterium]|jgi:hypothetical protein|nr:hypothetical protein [Chitinophagaceae bacterium]